MELQHSSLPVCKHHQLQVRRFVHTLQLSWVHCTPVVPQVLEAAVIAIPHPKWTERPLLIVVAAPDSQLSKEDMLNFLQVSHPQAHLLLQGPAVLH